ncbi:MAG: hypothetical protein HZB91_04215 [Elusimicrobia bacterium]|nr:hypothetical protein [Elusimicrobiota bacterium]
MPLPRIVAATLAACVMLATAAPASAEDPKLITEAGYAFHEWSQPIAACLAAGCQDVRNVDLRGPYGRVSMAGRRMYFWAAYESLSSDKTFMFHTTDAEQALSGALTETIRDIKLTQIDIGTGFRRMGSSLGFYGGTGTGFATFKKTNVVSYRAAGDRVFTSSVSYTYLSLAAGLYLMPIKHVVLSCNARYIPEAFVFAPTPLGAGLHLSAGAGLAF